MITQSVLFLYKNIPLHSLTLILAQISHFNSYPSSSPPTQ
nr:MAG TPA: hypothetical protein [Bacteriophage sp.]DAZ72185.1 MAG TPA: hypothetical protein [Caudoviricetes sp.]